MSKLRFGIAGLGFMGRSHLANVQQHRDAELVAVCDRDAARRRGEGADGLGNLDYAGGDTASLADVRGYETWEELVADPDVDAIVVALPTVLHADVTVAALEAGKHVLCEKPMGYRAADCDRMIAAERASGKHLMVAQCIRFWPQYELIRRLVEQGRIGAVKFARLERTASAPAYSADNWLMDASQSGGAILDLHVHDVDFAHWAFGLPVRIAAAGALAPAGRVDHVAATWTYDDGRFVTIEGGWAYAAPWPFDMALTVHGERGTLAWRLSSGSDVLVYAGGDEPERLPVSGDALRAELDYFVGCVLAGRPVERCTPWSSRISVVLSWLERRAVESGKDVQLRDRLRAAFEGGG